MLTHEHGIKNQVLYIFVKTEKYECVTYHNGIDSSCHSSRFLE